MRMDPPPSAPTATGHSPAATAAAEPLEDPPVRACRALAFTLLAFAWVYVVGIHTPQGIEYLKETSCQFVVRLAPVLYSPLWLAALFSPAAVAALALQHSLRQQPHQPPQAVQYGGAGLYPQPQPVPVVMPQVGTVQVVGGQQYQPIRLTSPVPTCPTCVGGVCR